MHIQDTYLTQQTITQNNGHPVGIEKMLVLIMGLQACRPFRNAFDTPNSNQVVGFIFSDSCG